ncbi:hypothetical protein, partial [Methanoculleus sp.]|uniref:hypothetical protein n=1 Tax=Methanoculleus sp. TaxID=90427 RepID=UPI0025EB2F65
MANTDKIVEGVNITELANKLRSGEMTVAQASSTSALDKNITAPDTQNISSPSANDVVVGGLNITELANKLRSGQTTIKSTSDIKDTSTIPEQSLDTKSPSLTTTTADSINSMIQKEQEALAAKEASAQKTLSDAGVLGTGNTLQEQLLTGYNANVPVSQYQNKLTEAQNQYGVIEALDEYKLQGEKVAQAKAVIENLDLQRQAELDATLNRQASMNSISAEQQRINQKYDSQRAKLVGDYNIEAAMLATQSNNLTEANKLVSQAVDAYTSDITAEINRFNNFHSIASDFVSSLSSEEKSVLDDVKTQLINKESEEKERLTNVLNLKLQYPNAGIEATDTLEEATQKSENQKNKETIQGLMLEYNQYGAGVTINDSYEEALKKIQPYYNEANRTTQIVGSAETGYSLIDLKTGEVIKDIKSTSQGNGTATTEPMSVWEIQQYNKLYGWTPPSGFSRKQIDDYVNLNPNLTPSELEAGAKQALLGITNDSGESIDLTSDYFKSLYTSDELYKIAEKNNLVNYW